MDIENEAGCGEDAETCEAAISLRQLRGDLQRAQVRRHDAAHTQDAGHMNVSNAGENDTEQQQQQDHMNASDVENEDEDGIEGEEDTEGEEDIEGEEDLGENISCKANRHYCIDFMTYKDRNACAEDELCRVVFAEEVDNVTGKKSWMCTPSQERCDEFMDEDFQPVDEYPPEYAEKFEAELEEEETEDGLDYGLEPDGQIGQTAGIYHVHRRRVGGTCLLRSCSMYMRHMTCQCNSGCKQYANCCPDYDYFCGERTTTTTTIPWWLTTTIRTPSPWFTPATTVFTTTTTKTTTTQLSFHGTSTVEGEIKTLYHTTSRDVAQLIVKGGFRPGRGGWCGGAIYFIDHPHLKKSKFNPKTTKTGAIVQAHVRMGSMAHLDHRCNGHGGHGVHAARNTGYNSLTFNPGDGDEYVIWDTQQVMSVRIYEYTEQYGPTAPRRRGTVDTRRRYEYHIHRRRGIRR